MLFLTLLACTDLPDGWEDAAPIEDFHQKACGESPYEEYETTVTATPEGDATAFLWHNAHFRCAQDVEGFYRKDGDLLQVLVQPVDMHPTAVAGCDCLYDISFTVEGAEGGWELWRRWDDWNDPNDPELVEAAE